ncbi:MAG: phosphohydrolase [Candidatus Staskawiczbacteria bacterium RIFOXYB1_FULL_37_44]|uniref:Phosphohydrolase n=1 Tax=Candidatus Staskawiczbacteria bacterium RIFOXYB1_FULL_37_44 TaxID=1802223 RepID=A0A1G2IXU7_9BACT|nr:MAG: phosphohydrolase [Candidatus Staskawiczbacteria bacterium RIFOXYB1_FULL_37_44]OGZ83816.1 MAG: phosphohydrolase [Candidatus Staskawiczbacteria bacterium RIFOXYC1_FULL_37_52]OGZ88404.1 MAG: phosphohydrolase [Candidatus Staskawiczbacteria bacterium RIFOXYC2_FULL_37_19]
MINKEKIIEKIAGHIKKEFDGDPSGHDWWHVYRVWKMAKKIQKKEGGDLFIIELGALLHDIGDWKFNNDEKAGSKKSRELLKKLNVDEPAIKHICDIVDNVSFKGVNHKNGITTLEGKIVQDADRLDAIGAICIARVFAYGGTVGRAIYDPKIKPKPNQSSKAYKKNKSSGINHFYEKILLLKDILNTKTAKKIAIPRHKFMEAYLKEFFKEWEAEV